MVANKLKIFRVGKGFSQKEIAEKMKIARPTYGLIESGKQKPTAYFVGKLSAAFPDTNFDWMLDSSIVSEPQAPYGQDTIESRLTRIEKKLDDILKKLE